MLARRECLADVGLFDERYFAYCEEAELAIRAKQAGWQVGRGAGRRGAEHATSARAPRSSTTCSSATRC